MAFEKHLLADGSNIAHAWPELKKLLERDRESARARLSRSLVSIHDAEQVRVTLVFDGKGGELVVERPGGHPTFSEVYTPAGTTADDVIEQLVAKSADPSSCCVATDDRPERQTVEALGASSISAHELMKWVARAEDRQRSHAAALQRRNDKKWKKGS